MIKEQGNRGNADIGMFGLAVMGENLAMNMESKGFRVAVYDIRENITKNFIKGRGKDKNFFASEQIEEFVNALKKPRKIMLMIRAGAPVDEVILSLLPLLEEGDIIIDGGNSHFPDTIRRTKLVESKKMMFVGAGVSGGEEGALKGPSLMPGGSEKAWEQIRPIFQAICAKADGEPCCEWVGANGAGHYVKMVHNGIEYGDMQLICEAYALMRDLLGMKAQEMQAVFSEWNKGKLNSYLIEITADILGHKDTDGTPLVEKIMDSAGQKGTGKWTGIEALEEGIPLTLIGEAVFSRCLSSMKEERVAASAFLKTETAAFTGDKKAFINAMEDALYAAKIVSYAQGFTLLRNAAKTYHWDLNYGDIALMWRGGCIIRSVFLKDIKKAFDENHSLTNLLLDPYFKEAILQAEAGWRTVCVVAIQEGITLPATTSALTYFDGYRTSRLPANLLQAQRDYFGAHTYERTDQDRGSFFHTNWTGSDSDATSSTYTV